MKSRVQAVLRERVHAVLREPFLHFLVLGALIFLGAQSWNRDAGRYRIVLSPARIARLTDTYFKQYGRPPEREQLQALIDQDIREEILYREGVALDLETEDQIVRRRVAQKFEILQLDAASESPVDERAVESFYRDHLADYRIPARVSFTHVFLASRDPLVEDPGARAADAARARKLLGQLRARGVSRAPDAGDRFAGPLDYSALDRESLSRVFGDSPVVQAVFEVPTGEWQGPFQSGYGWHLIRVGSREPEREPRYVDIRERVLADYREQARTADRAAAFARLRSKYQIVRESGSAG